MWKERFTSDKALNAPKLPSARTEKISLKVDLRFTKFEIFREKYFFKCKNHLWMIDATYHNHKDATPNLAALLLDIPTVWIAITRSPQSRVFPPPPPCKCSCDVHHPNRDELIAIVRRIFKRHGTIENCNFWTQSIYFGTVPVRQSRLYLQWIPAAINYRKHFVAQKKTIPVLSDCIKRAEFIGQSFGTIHVAYFLNNAREMVTRVFLMDPASVYTHNRTSSESLNLFFRPTSIHSITVLATSRI